MVGFALPCYTSRIKWIKWWVLHRLAILPKLNGLNGGFYIAFLHFQFSTGQTVIALLYLNFEWVTSFSVCLYLLVPSVLKVLNGAIA